MFESFYWRKGDNASSKILAPALVTFLLIISITLAISTITFFLPTPGNNTRQTQNYTEVNITIEGPDFSAFDFNWNGTNYSFYDSSLILAMSFNNNSGIGENSTLFADASIYGNNATCSACPNITNGKFGSGLQFNGSGAYIETGPFTDNSIDYARPYSKDSSASFERNLTSSWESDAVGDPFLVRNGSTTYLFYAGYNGSNWQIGYATNASSNLTEWTRYANNPVLNRSSSGWDGYHILGASLLHYPENSSLMEYNGAYWMAYEGVNGQSQIGIANSTDLITWERYNNNPVIMLGGSYDSEEVGDPYLFFDSATSTFYILYSAKNSNNRWSVALANSTDMLNWVKEDANPILQNSTAGFDNQDVGSPAIIKKNDMWYLIYPGYGTEAYVNRIGTAYGTSLFELNKTSSTAAIAESESFDRYGVGDPAVINDGTETYIFYEAINNIDPNNASGASIVRAVNYNPLSISFWLNLSNMGSWSRWLAKGTTDTPREWLFISDASGTYKFSVFKNGTEKSAAQYATISPGYNHIVGQYDGSAVTLWNNGVSVASTPLKGKIDETNQPLFIGKENGDANFFNGTIDELRIYNRSLSAGEIQMHYKSELQKYTATGLLFYSNITGLADGIYSYSAYVQNSTGSINQTGVNIIIVDNAAPVITITNPANASALVSGTTLTWINITTDENAVCRYNLTNSSFSYADGTNFTNTGNMSHSFQYSGLSAGQSYGLYYKCNDTVENINNASTYHSFSVSAAEQPAVATPSSGSGGAIGSTAKKTIIITPGAPLTKIVINLKTSIESPSVAVANLISVPASSPPGKIYQYFNITKKNFNNSHIDNASIYFEVAGSWILKNNITAVYIAQFDNGLWNELKTDLINSTATANYYMASSDVLSYFAIIGETANAVQVIPIAVEPQNETVNEEITEQPKEPDAPAAERPNASPYIAYAIASIILLISVYAIMKLKKLNTKNEYEAPKPKLMEAVEPKQRKKYSMSARNLPEIQNARIDSESDKEFDNIEKRLEAIRKKLRE